jgi:hypothetical protein
LDRSRRSSYISLPPLALASLSTCTGPVHCLLGNAQETAVDSNDGYVDLLDPIAFDVLHKERSFVEDCMRPPSFVLSPCMDRSGLVHACRLVWSMAVKSRRPQLKKAKKRAIVAAKEEIDELVERDKVRPYSPHLSLPLYFLL